MDLSINDELNQFQNIMRREYMDRLKTQIELEGDARYYRFIIKLADNYRKDNVDIIRTIIDDEKKIVDNEIKKIEKDITTCKERKDAINERKRFIPMLELELCILSSKKLPDSLFFPQIFQLNDLITPEIIKNINIKIESFFYIRFNSLVDFDESITHAHVTLAYLSYSPSKWNSFLKIFKSNYINHPEMRFSLLFFLSIWFESRPKHFLTKFPIFIDFIEEFNDGNLFVKHLHMILEQAKWNVRFMFLPLDGISPFFHLTYLQLNDKNKVIVGVDANSIHNSFKSNMMKKFDLKKPFSPYNPKFDVGTMSKAKDDDNNDGNDNDNINLNTNMNSNNQNQNKGKNSSSNNADSSSNANNNGNNENNDNDNNSNDKNENNCYELFKAFVVCMLAIQNTLSFDCFLEFDENEKENEDDYYIQCINQMNSIKLSKTENLKNLFTQDEYDFWRSKSMKIQASPKEIQKLFTIANGFSDWVVNAFNDKKNSEGTNDTIFENLNKIYEGVDKICPYAANLMKIDVSSIENESVRNKFKNKQHLIQTKPKSSTNNYEILFTEEQKSYQHKCDKFDKNDYLSLAKKISDINNLLKLKTNLSSSKVKKGVDLKLPTDVELNHKDCFNVDPHMVRIVFYYVTQNLFGDNDIKFVV